MMPDPNEIVNSLIAACLNGQVDIAQEWANELDRSLLSADHLPRPVGSQWLEIAWLLRDYAAGTPFAKRDGIVPAPALPPHTKESPAGEVAVGDRTMIRSDGRVDHEIPDFQKGAKRAPEAQPDWCQCGTCGRWWDDSLITDTTPTPAGRCPFEYEH